jgi:excisionase family DNA binding protein
MREFNQMENNKEIMTPDQAAEYLQLNRETIYRYIREGKLVASRLGRAYRIPRASLDLLLYTNQTIPGVTLRTYTKEQIDQFIEDDKLTPGQQEIVDRFRKLPGKNTTPAPREDALAQRRT